MKKPHGKGKENLSSQVKKMVASEFKEVKLHEKVK